MEPPNMMPMSQSNGEVLARTALFVGDLHSSVTEDDLYNLFSQFGPIYVAQIARDEATGDSLGHGFVNYCEPDDASAALEWLNYTTLKGKSIRIMRYLTDPTSLMTVAGNVFIKNLEESLDNRALHEIFSVYGNVLSCKVVRDPSDGHSMGYGFVQFDREESAQRAIAGLHGKLINNKKVRVEPFLSRDRRKGFTAVFSSRQPAPVHPSVDVTNHAYPPQAPSYTPFHHGGPSQYGYSQPIALPYHHVRPGEVPAVQNMPMQHMIDPTQSMMVPWSMNQYLPSQPMPAFGMPHVQMTHATSEMMPHTSLIIQPHPVPVTPPRAPTDATTDQQLHNDTRLPSPPAC